MKKLATHTTLFSLMASLAFLLASRAPMADEPVDPGDESVPALTDAAGASGALAEYLAGDPAAADAVETESARDIDAPASVTAEPPAAATMSGIVEEALRFDEPFDHTAEAAGLAIDTLDAAEAQPRGEMGATLADGEGRAIPLAETARVANETLARTLRMLDTDVLPGSSQRLSWYATEMFEDLPVATPVLVVNGRFVGPTLCVTAAVHGDELNGIEMVRRVMHDLDPDTLSGAVIGVPIVNLQGFRQGSRYLPDRRDLNRYFPGNPSGSAAARIAHSFFTKVIEHCDALVDLHTGSFDRANLPQVRADLRNPDVVALTHGFGATVILHSEAAEGTLRHAATVAGIPAVTLEAGGPSELELKEVMHGVKGIETLLNTLGMVDRVRLWSDQQPVYYRSSWVRANRGGILLADVSLGSTVRRGDLLGTITDPMNNASTNLYSPYSGRVIGMARNQVVMPGFAAFHVGIQAVEATRVEANSEPEAEAHSEQKDETLAREEPEAGQGDYVDGMSE